jgi:type IV secretory pathway VirJ component
MVPQPRGTARGRRARAVAALLIALAAAPAPRAPAAQEEIVPFGRFGAVSVYRGAARPSRVAIFISGDGGWSQGVVSMARSLASMDALVMGVDIRRYLKALETSPETCSYPASDFEALSQYMQKRLDLPRYISPVLVGYSSGATLVYATLVQAPGVTFRGGVSLGFCPDLPVTKPFCRGNGLEWDPGPKGHGVVFRPAATLEVPWIALQGAIDQVCDPEMTRAFVERVPHGEIVLLPRVGHGYSVERNWLPQFRSAFARAASAASPTAAETPAAGGPLADLPITEVPATGEGRGALVVWLTGDGGFGVTDKGVSARLAARGYPVAVLNSLHYYWKPKTPESAARDLARMLRNYEGAWKKDRFVLVGYSFGADVLPFLVNRLPADLADRVASIVLLGPSHTAHFEFHVTDWLGNFKRKSDRPVLPEVERLRGRNILAFYGVNEKDTIGPDLAKGLARVVALHGGHRIGANYESVADSILAGIR